MTRTTRLSYLMVLSWEIERKKKLSRSKALLVAWVITAHENITIYYLVKRHSHSRYPNRVEANDLKLFHGA